MTRPGLANLRHVVVLMLENRSFDHMLGSLPHVDGVVDAEGAVKADLFNRVDPTDDASTTYRPVLGAQFATPTIQQTSGGEYGGPSHSFPAATQQLFGVETVGSGDAETTPYGGGAPSTSPASASGFVASFVGELSRTFESNHTSLAEQQAAAKAAGEPDPVQEVMEVFTAEQLPAIHTLAREFCVCDRWHSEIPGPTEPNRLFMHAATSTGLTYNPWAHDILTAPTIYERIEQAGRDWAMYGFDLFDSANFDAIKDRDCGKLPMSRFFSDAEAGELPLYTFLCPRYADAPEGRANSQHAPHDVRYGDQLIADVYRALRSSSAWPNTLLVVTYDEHGGYYDHVEPPSAPAPDAATSPNAFMQEEARKYGKTYLVGPNYDFAFSQLGFRVPAILVSPWIQRGVVDSTPYQHTSVLRFLEDLLGCESLGARDAAASSFAAALSLPEAREDCPQTLPSPDLPAEDPELYMAEPPGPKQKEWTRRYTAKLEGHPDTRRRIAGEFPTNRDLLAYIEQRRRYDAWYRSGDWKQARFELYEDAGKRWRFHLRDGDGSLLAASTESYMSRAEAEKAADRAAFLALVTKQSSSKEPG
ncbi:MAG: DUF1508 domain-containing protein [Acidobacteria bacterium]|nr:MAG: DUF1508 domain-containing protein [Acidobacteriota bacterium]REK07739.1 MAG: DUF1508 domain-containing protein [Acidobacteriota bacterium]